MENSHVRGASAGEDEYLNCGLDSPLEDVTGFATKRANATAPVPATAAGVFDSWIAHTNQHARYGKESIDPSKSTSYAFIWRSWAKYLASVLTLPAQSMNGQAVMLATPINVAHFIAHGPTASKPDRSISKNTQKRYFTVLQRVYAFCAAQAWLDVSPVDAVAAHDRPDEENHEGHVLTAPQWDACTARIAQLTGNDYEIRDRAILMLLFKHGLRPEEIRALCVQDIQPDISEQSTLAINSMSGPKQERVLPLDETTAQAIQTWKSARRNLKVVKRTIDQLQQDFGNDDLHAVSNNLFVTEKKMGLSMVTLLTLVRTHIEKSCIGAGLPFPNRMGPQIVRNTRIVRWLNAGLEIQLVVKLAGLKNAKGLLHLRNSCSAEVNDQIQPARRRDDALYQTNILRK